MAPFPVFITTPAVLIHSFAYPAVNESLLITNTGGYVVFLGQSTVTTSNGLPLSPGEQISVGSAPVQGASASSPLSVYGISYSGLPSTLTVAVVTS